MEALVTLVLARDEVEARTLNPGDIPKQERSSELRSKPWHRWRIQRDHHVIWDSQERSGRR